MRGYMAENGGNNQPTPQPKVSKLSVEVRITFNPITKKVELEANTENWNLIMGMLIDALTVAHRTRITAEGKKVVLASPKIHLVGP
jgi:hypothetical protein